MLPKRKIISIQIPHDVVSDSVCSVAILLRDFNAVGAMKFAELVRIADDEVHPFGSEVPCCRNVCTLPRFMPAKVGGSPHVNARVKPRFFV